MNEFCVVPDKEFLARAKKFNLSEGSLKSITYAYRKNHQGEDPSDDYIAYILKGRNPIEDGNNWDYKNAVAVWLKHYSLDTLFTDRELWVDAIKKALLFFPQPSAVVSYLDSKGNFVLHVARPLIKSGNITYNEEQLNAIDAVTLFVLDKKSGIGTKTKYITVEGEAGTGKTTIVNLVIRNLAKEGRYMSVHVCAVSNKAVLNIVEKVESAAKGTRIHVEGHSIAAELGAKMDDETGTFKFEDNTSSWKEIPIDSAGVIFVDEASMINEEVIEYLDKASKNHPRLAMIFLGDLGQLPPIRSADNPYYAGKAISQNTPSPVFTGADTEVHTLTDRVRLGEGSPILGVTHALHEVDTKDVITDKEFLDVITLNTEDRITSQGAVIYKSSSNQDDIISMVADAFLAAKDTLNPFHAKIVAYRNVTIEGYNKRIRSVVFPNETRELVKGDMIILNNRYEPDVKNTLTNSQEFVVTSVRDTAKDEYGVTYHELVVKDKTGSYIIKALLQSNKDNFVAFRRAKDNLWDLYREETNPIRKRNLKAKAIDYTYNKYAFIDYGYAITSHKAQGSTYDISIVDMSDINSVSMTSYKTKLQSIYTAITRAANVVMIIGKKDNGSTVDLEEVNKEIASYKQTKKAEPLTTIGNTFEPIDSANDAKRFASKEESKATISSKKTILSNKELALWNAQGVDNMPRILSASERTDPAFHAKEIIDIIEGRKTISQWGIVNGKRQIIGNLAGKDFAGLYLITKHDGLPMLKLLETKIPKLIHFSITTLGGTQFEPGVMKFNDLLDKILEYINQGLDPDSVTIRIDPIVPGVTKFEDIETVIKRATKMGIKRIRFSIMDAYANTRKAMSSFYDFNKYYDNFHAKQLYIEEIANFMLSMKSKYDITLGTCAEPLVKAGIEKEGCLSVAAVNLMLGTAIEDKGTANNTQRQLCSCYGGKIDALAYNSKCASHCIYCYAKHENEKALEYYNEDGTLKTDEEIEKLMESINQTKVSSQPITLDVVNKTTQSGRSDNYTPEMLTIKAKAIADGTFMKAPNGKPTNLTERQWLQVRTKNFINWFGDWINDPANASKVVDENGEPLVVYHHSDNSNLTKFSTEHDNYFAKDGGTKEAIFFDENKTGTLNRKYDIPVFLNIRDLHEYNETKEQLHQRGTTYREIVNESAAANNVDGGVHMKDFDDNKLEHQSVWIVHNPNQIKSATNNSGAFSNENPDINDTIILKATFVTPKLANKVPIQGENISSKQSSSEFARLLTNPGNNVQVEYKGRVFRNAEHAYQTWKSGEFDEVAYNNTAFKPKGSKPVNKATNYQTMVEILTAKLQQHPDLVQGITERGGLDYLNASTHNVIGDDYWESTGQNKFMEALKEAYSIVTEKPSASILNNSYRLSSAITLSKEMIENQLLPLYVDGITTFLGFDIVEDDTTTGMRNSQDGTIHINKEGLSNKWLQKLWEDPDSKDTNIPDFQTIEDLITWGLYRVVGEYFVEHKSGERPEDYSNRLNDWATMQTNTISALEAKLIIEEESDEPLTLPKTPVPSVTLTPIEIADSIYRGVYSLHIDTSTADSFGKNTESLKTLINDVPISGLVALPTTPSKALFEVIKFFQKNNMYATSKTIDVNIGDNKELLKAAREAHLIVNEGVVLVPGFIKGLSEEEIILIDLDTKLTESGLFSSLEIISLAKATMFKVSEFVTMLQSQSSANEILLGDAFKDVDFTKMSRIEIINKVTLTKLLNIVCDRFFDTEMNGNIPFNLWDKADLIRENWQAFILKGFSQLINMEEIAITGKLDVKSELLDTDEYDDEQTVMEIFGNTIEHWQVGFRQISAFSSLSLLIKRTLQKIYVLDADGNQVIDEWGFAKTINPLEAVALILSWTLHAQTIEDMITILKRLAGANPWLNYLVSENTDPNSNIYQLLGGKGKLVGDDELFKSQFFSNFRKYFQKYSIIYKDVDTGEVRIKMINEKSFADLRMLEVMAGYKNPDLGAFPLLRLDGTVNLETLDTFNTLLTAIKSRFDSLTEAEKKTPYGIDSVLAGQLKQLCDILGITGIEEENLKNTLFTTDISTIVKKADYIFDKFNKEVKENPNSNPFAGKRSVLNDYKTIIIFVTRSSNEVLEAVSYEAGKMYYSYVLPSYMNRYIEKLKGFTTENDSDKAEAEYQAMMDREFRRFRWFYNQNKKTYRNVWIEKLATDPEVRRMFEHKAALHRFGVNYVDKTPALYTASMILEFFYDTNKRWAWYRVPTLSNKPSEEYIRFIRYHDGYENIITNNLVRTFVLEIERILTVRERNKVLPKDLLIKSFDINGLKFNFLDFLEEYRDASTERGKTEFGQALRDALDGKLDLKDGPIFNKLIEGFKTALRENLEERFLEAITKYRAEGLITEDFSSTYINLGDTPESRREALREFYWNDFFASTQMLQIFITDMAYYKDAEDLQKRLALLHAPGMRANKLAKHMDWGIPGQTDAGLLVSDGYLRTFYLKDSVIKAEVVANLKILKQKRLAEAKNLQEKNAIDVMFSDIIAAFEDTNFADALAYSSPTSYRKKMNLFGKWDAKLEQAYLNIISDNFATEDLQVIWLPLKPFVYTQISKSSVGIFDTIKMGIQNKNAEYVLIVADALLRSGNMPNRLSAIFDIMEESATDANGKKHNHGIDTVQFESTVKTGLTGIININDDAFDKAPEELTAEDIKNHIRSKIYTTDAEGKTIFNEKYVHDIPVEDYIIQLELPAHFQGEQQQGSLNRILSIADSPNYDANGNENYIVVNGKRITVKEAKQQYFKAAAENIQKSIDLLVKRFLLDSSDIKIQNIAISRLLRDEILRDNRCDNDLLWACSVNKDGEFNIPLSDPTQSNRIQLLLNSIIKNTIDKQKIAGGPVVQVSSYGLSHALHVRWKDKNGNILMTEEEFAEAKPGESYEKYLIDNLYALAYLEAYLPIPSQQFYLDFVDADGNIDLEKVEKYAPDMLKMICYRIPTEGKYSMMPIKVVGFLPINAGEAIMLPAEITKMSGSDFDADKMYVMRHSLQRIVSTDKKGFGLAYEKYLQDNNKEDTIETRIDFVKENGNKYQTVKYQRYSSGREANNDIILDVLWGMLTDPNMLELVWTPGNFDEPKKLGYLIQAFVSEYTRLLSEFEKIEGPLKKPSIDALALYKKLKNMSVDELKELSYKKKNLLYADVQMDFHKQNMIAAKLIGVFAQANVSHAFISLADNDGNPAFITIDNEDGDKTFVLNGHNISGDVPIDRYLNFNEIRTSSILAALLAASVDAVKDPVLNLMNINMNTVNVAVTLIRLGFSIETAALLLSQPAVKNAIMQFERISDTLLFASLSTVIGERLGILMKAAGISEVNTDTFTYDDELLINALVNNVDHVPFVHYRILNLFNRVLNISKYFSMITHMTRYNSITAGVGPHAANTMNRKLLDENFDKTDALRDVKRVVYNNPILERFRVGAYEIEGKLLGGHIIQASPKFQGILSQLLSIIGFMNDEISDKFSDFFMSYIGNPTFDLSLSNREYMLKEFPKEILAKKKLHPDNLFVKLLQYNAPSEKEEFPTLSINTRGRNDTDLIKAAWGELLKVDEKFALLLAEYSFFRGGFGFNPKTFSSLMPSTVKMALKNYINNLNNFGSASESYLTPDYVARLINQFILNNLDLVSVKSLKLLDSKQILDLRGLERTIGADRFQQLVSHKPVTIYYSSFYDIKTKDGKGDKFSFKQVNGLCKAALDGKPVYLYVDKQHVTMQIVDRLGGGQQGFEIDPNVDFPSTIYSEVLQTVSGVVLDSGLAPIPALEDLQATMSAIIFDLYTLEELRQLPERYKTEYKGDIDDVLYEILLKYQEAIGRELSESEKLVLYNSGKQTKNIIDILSKNSIEDYQRILNNANKTIKELNLCE